MTVPARKRVRRGNQQDADQLRQELMQAAVELVAEQGAHALTVRAVAQRVGVSAMTPYRYFADKTELLEGVWREAMGAMGEQVAAALAGARGGREKQRASIDAFLRYWEEHADYYCLLFGFDRVGQQHQSHALVPDSALYGRLLELQRTITEEFARELGANADHIKLASEVRLAMELGYLHGTLIVTRYPWSHGPVLRASYIEQTLVAVENCLRHGPVAVPEAAAVPRRRASDRAVTGTTPRRRATDRAS